MTRLLLIVALLLPSCSVKPKSNVLSYNQKKVSVSGITNKDRRKLQNILDNIAK